MEYIAVEKGRISNFQGLLTLTLDPVILHTVVHHSSISTYMPNFIEIEETFYGRTFETGFIRSTQKIRLRYEQLYDVLLWQRQTVLYNGGTVCA